MPFNDPRRARPAASTQRTSGGRLGGLLALLGASAAVGAVTPAAVPAAASAALCTAQQRVVFHCSVGAKVVSLCAGMDGARVASLQYRYGTPGRVELTYPAATASAAGSGFNATVSQLAPQASVRQVWFDRAGYTYLLSQCVGGACPHAAGLAVLQGDRVVSRQRCQRTADDRAWFAPELARFGSDAASSQALTEALRFDDVDLGVDQLYAPR